MKRFSLFLAAALLAVGTAAADVRVDARMFGERLGGWTKRGRQAAEYSLSGATYRTYRPEVTKTPDGGLFVSLRIDHVRGMFSSDDHAVLELTIDREGSIASAQSTIAIQGRSITSDLIRGGTTAGQELGGVDRAVKIGTDLVADLSAKMLREKIVEAGRVSFPAALRHNYNLLFQTIVVDKPEPEPVATESSEAEVADPPAPAEPAPSPEEPKPTAAKLDIKGFGETPKADLPTPPKK